MQEQFNISTATEIIPEDTYLGLQVGSHFISFCIYDPDTNQLLQLKRYGLNSLVVENLETVIEQNPILNGNFNRILTGLDFGFNTLLPADLSDIDPTVLMYLENADQQDHVITEPVCGALNRYTVPPQVLTWLVHHFPSSSYFHAHTIQIASAKDVVEQGLLRVDFSENLFSVTAFKGASLLLAKTYRYRTPADLIFYLLKIAEVYGLKQEQVQVQLSGLIDESSKLYKEVYDYFLHTSVRPARWGCADTDTPSHYFTALNELVICESFQEA